MSKIQMNFLSIPSVLAVFAIGSIANATVLILPAFEDISLDKGSNSQSGRNHLLVGNNSGNGPYTSLVAFNVSNGFSGVVLGAGESIRIDTVTLTLYQNSASGSTIGEGDAFTMRVDQYDFDFSPVSATYEAPATGDTTPGGNLGTSFGTISVTNPDLSGGTAFPVLGTSTALTTAVQSSLDGSSEFRLVLSGQNPSSTQSSSNVGFVRLGRAGTNPTSDDSVLTINYTVVPEPSALVLGCLGALTMLRRRR